MSDQNKRDAIKAAVRSAMTSIKTGVRAGGEPFMKEGPIFVKSSPKLT